MVTAEGGTKYQHAVSIARSATLLGPYEVDSLNPMLTSSDHSELVLQKAGHASLVETQNGEWYLAHLCGRPTAELRCTLGRETALQRCFWDDNGWLRIEGGGNSPSVHVKAPLLPAHPFEIEPEKDDFDESTLRSQWSTLRIPPDTSWLTLSERKGYLRLRAFSKWQD